MNELRWVTVTTTNGIIPAEMLAQRLQTADIPARAVQEAVGKAYGFTVGPMGVAYVLVPAERLEEARSLLGVEAEASEDDIVTCPHCKSEIELDDTEWEQGWFVCPACAERVSLDDLY